MIENEGKEEGEEFSFEKEIGHLWADFLIFRVNKTETEKKIRRVLTWEYRNQDGSILHYAEIEQCVEGMLLIMYGANWGLNVCRRFSIQPEGCLFVPRSEKSIGVGHNLNTNPRWVSTEIQVGIPCFLDEFWSTGHTSMLEKDKESVSHFFSDRKVVDLLLSGVEEWAHHLSLTLKDNLKARKMRQDYLRMEQLSCWVEGRNHTEESRLTYHMSDIEYRGLIWKNRMLYELFPSLYGENKEFQKIVGRLRCGDV